MGIKPVLKTGVCKNPSLEASNTKLTRSELKSLTYSELLEEFCWSWDYIIIGIKLQSFVKAARSFQGTFLFAKCLLTL